MNHEISVRGRRLIVTDEDWEALKALADRDFRDIKSEAAFLLARAIREEVRRVKAGKQP